MRGITIVNIGGEIRTLSLKNNFLVLLGIQLGCDPLTIPARITEICEDNPFQAITLIIYCGLIANFDREANFAHLITIDKEQAKLTLKIVAGWMDDASDTEMESVWREFSEIIGIPKASEEQIAAYEERLKKNLPQTVKPKRKPSQ